MGIIKRSVDDLSLYWRYSCRKLGLPGYQIHQIYLPEQQLVYIPIPKNACTSIKHALHEIEFGKRFDADLPEFSDYREHHDYYKKRPDAFTSLQALQKKKGVFRFALVRDPVKRLLSCYRNRVVDLGDLESSRSKLERFRLPLRPDLNAFIKHLADYRRVNKGIEHHSRPQAQFLDGSLEYLDRVYTLDEMPELIEMLRKYKPDLEMRRRKTGGTTVTLADLSEEALHQAIDFYREDYELLEGYVSSDDVITKHTELCSE
ncbi:sulfotransferase family 2 domain-containing protein [Fodinibius salsisoli]|uniref:Sulfotransferase family 2 domain-containing protein n=1 Tax=Fodinibius salsisoli TaxID=2820877 RepID=A0ABT3PRN6_9BACT|nr:sulfotransferase family 2 domain-containing protein [Fodinibius salsisoli]MCW9708532.1 sulfotransferase family 2 domain-containing protein [Fodinibius salsisoli]